LAGSFSLRVAVLLCVFLFPFVALAQKAEHPLDALRTEEYWAVYDVLQASGHLDDDTHYASVLLHEPAKDVVLRWNAGQSVPREADVTLMRKGVTIEARVDVAGRKLESWKEVPGAQAPIFVSEILGLSDTILSDERVKKALEKRGIKDLNQVECASVPLGYFAFPEQEGHRIAFADCDLLHGVYHSWGRTIGGLTIEVDLSEKKILRVFDDGLVPMPGTPVRFEEAPEVMRPGTKPGIISEPEGPSFEIKDGEVAWQNWRFRFRLCSLHGRKPQLVDARVCGQRRILSGWNAANHARGIGLPFERGLF
jgi:primary-amine oxidase